jgi:hypothetical protein
VVKPKVTLIEFYAEPREPSTIPFLVLALGLLGTLAYLWVTAPVTP